MAARPTANATPKDGKPRMDLGQAALFLKQASDPLRILLLVLLSERERNVGDLCDALSDVNRPTVSHHLALLRHGRLAKSRREGKCVFYSLTDQGQVLAELVATLMR